MNDHDLLMKIDTKLSSICSQVSEIKESNMEDHKDFRDKIIGYIEHCGNCRTDIESKFVSKGLFWKMVGFLTSGGIIAVLVKVFI